MTRIFRYILMSDTGMAPCVAGGLVSLATCKPKIRATAIEGDWVLGFVPSPGPRGLLVWAGRVAKPLEVGDYEALYRGRPDAQYRRKRGGGYRRLDPTYHPGPDEIRKDLSAPVLTFDPAATWYFGAHPRMLPDSLLGLAAGGRGHRVNGATASDAIVLADWLASVAQPGVHGEPHRPRLATKTKASC
jgi:hypothetical protein